MNTFEVRLDDTETDVFLAFMQACGLSTVNAAIRTALFTQCRLSEIDMPSGCFAVDGPRARKVSLPSPEMEAFVCGAKA